MLRDARDKCLGEFGTQILHRVGGKAKAGLYGFFAIQSRRVSRPVAQLVERRCRPFPLGREKRARAATECGSWAAERLLNADPDE